MRPALLASLLVTTSPGFQAGPIHNLIKQWSPYQTGNNEIPSGWSELDGRKHYLQAKHNRYVEMHPNGTRGVTSVTEYCVLSILIFNITGVRQSNDSAQHDLKWNVDGPSIRTWNKPSTSASRHIIRGNATGHYLCMDDRSAVYQSLTFNKNHCVFDHEYDGSSVRYNDRYFHRVNSTMPKWYLGMNKDGSIRCGNVARWKQKGANFIKLSLDKIENKNEDSPPFNNRTRECCKTAKCKRRKNKNKALKNTSDKSKHVTNDKTNGERRKRRCYKKWCRRHRRRFFTLKLKELRRYYNRCVKKIRHCPKKEKTEER